MKLNQRGVLITGASKGLGKEIARACVAEGASVLLCARDGATLDETRSELAALAGAGQKVLAMPADMRDPKAVEELVRYAAELPNFKGVVNNAGAWGPKGLIEDVDWAEWQAAVELNLFGVVHVCRFVVPHFRRAGYGKIVNLSGGGATSPMPYLSAYAASKAAVVRFSETLADEVKEAGIDVNAVAPGALNTAMLDEILSAGREKVGPYYDTALKQKASGGASLERAAALCVYLLSGESDGITAKLISAVWDPWERLHEVRNQLGGTDVYTLRRIVPKDRGQDWE